jgi:hyperpolarization activated cyclic nucleotide-gated potassium channel 2
MAKQIWDVYCLLLVIYVWVVVPFRLAFGLDDTNEFKIIGYVIDISFLVDIFLTFFSSYFDEKKLKMVETHRAIAYAYITSWFIFDVLSILPLEPMFSGISGSTATSIAKGNQAIRIARISKIYKLVRFVRIIKGAKIFQKKTRIRKIKDVMSPSVTRILYFFVIFLVCLHIFTCIWLGMARLDGQNWLKNKLSSLNGSGENISLED